MSRIVLNMIPKIVESLPWMQVLAVSRMSRNPYILSTVHTSQSDRLRSVTCYPERAELEDGEPGNNQEANQGQR